MTRKQFDAALKRYGFRKVLYWIDIGGGSSVGMVLNTKTLKPNYRASLSKALKERDERAA